MGIVCVGMEPAKIVFSLHGVKQEGPAGLVQLKIARVKLNALVASLPPRTIGIKACSGAPHWARQFQAHGHAVRLMAPKLVTPYRTSGKRGKNDAADAAAICEAVQRPGMRFVTVKPAIDRRYASRPGPESTFVASCSMGGLISIYALCGYPQVFGGAAGLSTHGVGRPTAWGHERVRESAAAPPPMP